jgi:hypothetical protein
MTFPFKQHEQQGAQSNLRIYDFFSSVTSVFKSPNILSDYFNSFTNIPSIFMGINKPNNYPELYLTFITILRFIGFALFTSIIIKRYSRR